MKTGNSGACTIHYNNNYITHSYNFINLTSKAHWSIGFIRVRVWAFVLRTLVINNNL